MLTNVPAMSIFVRVVEANSFAAAARSLLIDPSAVSRAIKTLETDLGVLLFARSTRALKLTAEGSRFHRECVQILKRLGDVARQFRSAPEMPYGELKVGMGTGLTRRMLLRAIPPFRRQYPEIKLVLLSVHDMTEIGDEGIDILIRPRRLRQRGGNHSEPQGLVVRKLAQSKLIVCASPEYLGRVGPPRAPADLVRYDCVAHVNLEHDVQDEWQFAKSLARQKVKFVPKLLVHGTDALREAGVSGCGIIRSLTCHIDDELCAGKLVPVLGDWECIGAPPIVAIYRKTRPALPQVSVFVQYLVGAFRRYR
jgi:LysR family transcriptional regulator, regulator for bpeEF and oprC